MSKKQKRLCKCGLEPHPNVPCEEANLFNNDHIQKGYTVNVLDKGFVRLIDWMGTDERICEAARISYRSPSKGKEQDEKLINYLWRNRHTSPFEQVNITFNIKLPLFVQGQMVRHRTQRLNQVSARYTEMEDDFYIPTEWRKQDTKNKQGSIVEKNWNPIILKIERITKTDNSEQTLYNNLTPTEALKEQCEFSYQLYKSLLSQGVSREMARMVLPQNLYTEIYTNWDLNNLMKFFSSRIDDHAQYEIQEYALAMKEITKKLFPITIKAFDRYKFKCIEDV